MDNDGTIWDDYPEEVLEQALLENAAQEAEFATRPVCVEDPYNMPMKELVAAWIQRRLID